MAERDFKVNDVIPVIYQAPNAETGLVGIVAEIYLPNGSKDTNFPDVALVERGSSGTYVGEFTPNAQGEWQTICHKAGGDGQVTKRYSVGAHNVHSVGEAVGTVDGKVVAVDGKVDTVDGKVVTVGGKVDTVDGKVVTATGKIDALDAKVTALGTAVGALDSPPMVC
jgi:hypothetical protein